MFDDITPPTGGSSVKRTTGNSIRDVTPLQTADRKNRRIKRAERRQVPTQPRRSSAGGGRFGIWILAIVIFSIALSAIGFVFIGKTTITVVPQQESVNLSANVVYTAYKNAEEGELAYEVIPHTIEATDTIAATGSELVKEKASGRIVVYNNHSSAPQRLIKNTRFEAPNGAIYRVRNSIIVPGMVDGEQGALEITVYADKEGQDQDITNMNTRFSIPGLKGDPRYDTFYAKIKEPIVGGFVGERAVVDEDVLNATQTRLRQELQDRVRSALQDQIPVTSEWFEEGTFIEYESAPVAYNEDKKAVVKEVARIYAVTFDKGAFARMLATAALATPEEGDIRVETPKNLEMEIINKSGVDIISDALVQFTLKGATTLTWQIDTESLKNDLAGKHSGALNTVMSGYPGIKSAQATIRPFWKKEFPTETERISIDIAPEKKK
tara:strand:+ start:10029 stop:11342 length:1314 start_codon:yes stop_codon:yes gene_type:complete